MPNSSTTSSGKDPKATKGSEEAIDEKKTAEGSTSSGGKEKKDVAKLEAQVEELQKKVTNAQNLQGQADKQRRAERVKRLKLEKRLEKIRRGEVDAMDEDAEVESSIERDMRLKAKMEIKDLLLENPDYQAVLAKDPTLKDILLKNPFAIISEYYDEQDAVDQIRLKLDDRVRQSAAQQSSQGDNNKEEEEGAPKFEAGAVEPKGESVSGEEIGESEQGQTLEEKQAKSISDKIKSGMFGE